MFNISAVEFVLLLVLAVMLFGPERLPEFSRKAARVLVYLRDIANNAQTQLRTELGPEYSNLELKDLNPKTFISKHMQSEIAAIEEARKDLLAAKRSLDDATKAATGKPAASGQDKDKPTGQDDTDKAKPVVATAEVPALDAPVVFDTEAT